MGFSEKLKDSFILGLVLLAPLIVTLLLLQFMYSWTVKLVGPLVKAAGVAAYTANIELAAQLATAGVIVFFITLIGYLSQSRRGELVFGDIGKVAGFIPLFGTLYTSIRQVSNALMDKRHYYDRAVMVEYPREGVMQIGFVTGRAPENFNIGEGKVNVFIPNSPNPTSGKLVMLDEEELVETDMSVREALKTVVTSGVASKDS